MHTKCFKITKLTLILCFFFSLVLSDIRIDNNQLSAEGRWEIKVNKDYKGETMNKNEQKTTNNEIK